VPPRTVTSVWLRGTCLRPTTWAAATWRVDARGAPMAAPGTAIAASAAEPVINAARRNWRRFIPDVALTRSSMNSPLAGRRDPADCGKRGDPSSAGPWRGYVWLSLCVNAALMKKAVPLWIRCFVRLSTHHALILSLSKDHPELVEGSS